MNKLENVMVNTHEEKYAYEKVCVKMLDYTKIQILLDKLYLYKVYSS